MEDPKYMVAVVGAGPAGLFAARKLAEGGAHVILFNRDIKPGGLAEYGIYPDKLKMKQGLRSQFKQILASGNIDYYGNVTVCCGGNIVLEDLLESGFQAVLVTTGAQGTKWLRLPGENLPGVYHAKYIVYHYNLLPPFSSKKYLLGKKVAVVGAGNVMMDVAHYLIRDRKVEEVIAVVRRGPGEVKFTRKEMETVGANLDIPALEAEFARVKPCMEKAGQDVVPIKSAFLDAVPKAIPPVSETRFRFEFLASPVRILGDWMNGVTALKVEDNTLLAVDGNVKARGTGNSRQIEADTIIFAIGDTVDKDFCIPILNDAYMAVPQPHFPVDGISYEAANPDNNQPIERVFLAGWARQASTGLVGVARRDGEHAAQAVLAYLQTQPPMRDLENVIEKFEQRLEETHQRLVDKAHLAKLEEAEVAEARKLGTEEYKFATNDEMFTAMGY
ncbi:MAG TPA: FAD-dependent oxidoreductase [Anaerolineales bacterium]|nr:FAD-dependent oxidoreductase [Anaerolineales bacterium]